MHQNPSFRRWPKPEAVAFARFRGFGILTAAGPDGPLASHIPFVLSEDGRRAEFHLMRSNPLARALGEAEASALLVVSGPDAYVSPDWYEIGPDQVPTWNYQAVHLFGRARLAPAETLRPHLERLSAHFEARLAPKPPWTIDKTTPGYVEKLMRGVTPAEMTVERIESTMKLNQNKPHEARRAAAEAIAATPAEAGLGSETARLAALMRRTADGD